VVVVVVVVRTNSYSSYS